jgi:NTP pyrophosphatase (non-canonical NTP hydrolase)
MKRQRNGRTLDRLVRAFADQAEKNLAKWGKQEMETLCLCIAEETGELAQAVLQARHDGGDPDRIRREAIDLGALCAQMVLRFHEDN